MFSFRRAAAPAARAAARPARTARRRAPTLAGRLRRPRSLHAPRPPTSARLLVDGARLLEHVRHLALAPPPRVVLLQARAARALVAVKVAQRLELAALRAWWRAGGVGAGRSGGGRGVGQGRAGRRPKAHAPARPAAGGSKNVPARRPAASSTANRARAARRRTGSRRAQRTPPAAPACIPASSAHAAHLLAEAVRAAVLLHHVRLEVELADLVARVVVLLVAHLKGAAVHLRARGREVAECARWAGSGRRRRRRRRPDGAPPLAGRQRTARRPESSRGGG